MGKQKKQDKTQLLAALLLLLAGFFVFLFFLPEGKNSGNASSGITQTREYEERVNKHLFHTSQNMELAREKMQMEADKIENQGVGTGKPRSEVHKLDFSADPRAEALLHELGREVKESNGPIDSYEQVQTDLFQAQQAQEYSEAYKREYARQFIENARKAGYLIKLSDDYKVISVKPLRKPADSFELFNKSGGGGAQ